MTTRQYHLIDIMKFIMAICVIAIHSFLDYLPEHPVMEFIVRLAVPFFFITTGFFLAKKLFTPGVDRKDVCHKHLRKSIPRYLRWIGVYLPIALIVLITTEQVWYKFAARYVIGVILLGETPYAWPLWFMLTVIMSVAVIYFLLRLGVRLRYICLLGLAVLIAGLVYENISEIYPTVKTMATKVFPPRILTGFGAICLGMAIAYVERSKGLAPWMALPLLIASLILFHNTLWMWELIGGASIFIFAASIKLPQHPSYIHFRQCSMLIYFLHMMPLGLLYIFVAQEPDFSQRIDFFIITTLVTLVASLYLSTVMKRNPKSAIARFI